MVTFPIRLNIPAPISMADQPLNTAAARRPGSSPRLLVQFRNLGGQRIAKLSWLSQFDGSLLLGGEMKASNTPAIRPPFPRAVTNFRA